MTRALLPVLLSVLAQAGAVDGGPETAAAAPRRPVVVIADRDTRAYQKAIEGIERSGRKVQRLATDDPATARTLGSPGADRCWLALGPRAAGLLAAASVRPRAAAFVRASQIPTGLAAVTLEVPFDRQLGWLTTAFPGRQRLVVLRQPGGAAVDDAALAAAAKAAGFDLVLADVRRRGDAVPALEAVLRERRQNTLLWLLPDPVAVSTDTVVPLIQAALAARVPTVGFSDYFLRVGAMAAATVDYHATGHQALQLADDQSTDTQPPQAARLVVDGRLAERLGIAVTAGDGVEVRR